MFPALFTPRSARAPINAPRVPNGHFAWSAYVRIAPKADIEAPHYLAWLQHYLLDAFVTFLACPEIRELHHFLDRLAGMRSGYDKPGFV